MSAKQIVEGFYTSDFFNDSSNIEKYLHPDMTLHWNSSNGYSRFKRNQMEGVFAEAGKSYDAVSCVITHLLEDKDTVTIRFTYLARTIDSHNEEIALAHFIAIWTVKDDMLHEGFQISQPAEDTEEALASYNI